MWNAQIPFILKDAKDGWDAAKYPHFTRWQEAMMVRDSLKYVMSVLMEKEVKSEGRA
jgi:glutathione S-transferase